MVIVDAPPKDACVPRVVTPAKMRFELRIQRALIVYAPTMVSVAPWMVKGFAVVVNKLVIVVALCKFKVAPVYETGTEVVMFVPMLSIPSPGEMV